MKHQIGVCSICGGAVTKYFGGMGGGESIPTCEKCGAVRDTTNVCNVHNAYAPVIPMRQIIAGGGGKGGGGGGNTSGWKTARQPQFNWLMNWIRKYFLHLILWEKQLKNCADCMRLKRNINTYANFSTKQKYQLQHES